MNLAPIEGCTVAAATDSPSNNPTSHPKIVLVLLVPNDSYDIREELTGMFVANPRVNPMIAKRRPKAKTSENICFKERRARSEKGVEDIGSSGGMRVGREF